MTGHEQFQGANFTFTVTALIEGIWFGLGFVLSGWYRYEAICPSCREIVFSSRNTGLALLIKPAFDLYKSNVQRKKLLRTRGPRFSWSKGVVGEKVPDKVLEDVVKPVSLENMVEMLQKRV